MSNIVAVENIDVSSEVEQLAFEFSCNGRFPSARESRQPEHAADVAIAGFSLAGCNFAVTPVDIVTLVSSIVCPARVIIGCNDASARQIKPIHNHEPAHRGDV